MIDIKHLYWAAGIIEGEGTIGCQITKPPKVRLQLVVRVSQSNEEVLQRLHAMFGGSIRIYITNGLSHKLHYVWTLSTVRSAGLIMTIYPLMSKKRQYEIRNALSLWKSFKRQVKLRRWRKSYAMESSSSQVQKGDLEKWFRTQSNVTEASYSNNVERETRSPEGQIGV